MAMAKPQVAPYGSWRSPISADMLVAERVSLDQVRLDGGDLYWNEGRPTEQGRLAVVRRSASGEVADLLPPPWNARSRVHEYGGGAYAVHQGTLFFSNFADNRLYRLDPGDGEPRPLTSDSALRYADLQVDAGRGRVLCVREDHRAQGSEATNTIVAVNAQGDPEGGTLLVEGCDFYAAPRLSPDGRRLAWLQWNHPNMPWDGTELWIGTFGADGRLASKERVAGGPDEAICLPVWSPGGVLHFIGERTGWWNIYRWNESGRQAGAEPLCPMEAEFGSPLWQFGGSSYAFESEERIVCTYGREGIRRLGLLDTRTGDLQELGALHTDRNHVRAAPGYAYFISASPTEEPALVRLSLASGEREVIKRSGTLDLDPAYLSAAQPVAFPTEGGLTAHAFYYPPANPDFVAPQGELPPLVVMSHGGPTSATFSALDLGIQFWTSRGIAVLDVNYGGSTGYGREYRRRLNGRWGVVDVDDCINGARYLVGRGLADPERLAITGGSAGGYTTLCALTFHDVFKVGASYYGVADLEMLDLDSHKFESRYNHSMIGPYPQARDLYRERSPIHHTHRLSCPIIFFQGKDDMVVPPSQSRMMVNALKEKGLPVAYLEFEGEGHGFRQAANIIRSAEAELYFYSRILGFTPADDIMPVEIDNL